MFSNPIICTLLRLTNEEFKHVVKSWDEPSLYEGFCSLAEKDFDNSYTFASLLRLSSSNNNSNAINSKPNRIIKYSSLVIGDDGVEVS
jgi:hypothetical protein